MPTVERWVPEGWEPNRALPAWDEELPEGLWLDATRLDRPNARRMLQNRLCAADHALVRDRRVDGFALAERLFQHCARQAEWSRPVPVAETLFRAVLGASDAGLALDGLVKALDGRSAVDIAVRQTLVRRLGPALRRAYPVHWAERRAGA